MLALVAAFLLAASPGLTTAEAQARLVQASPVSIVDRSQRDRPEYRLVFDPTTAAALRPSGNGTVVRGRRVWRNFAFAGDVYDEASAGTYRFKFSATPTGSGLAVDGLRGPPASRYQPDLPLRAIFYYDWFPEGWTQEGIFPFTKYQPSLGWYDSSDPATIRRHVDAMLYGHLAVGIFDWWGIGTNQDRRLPTALAVARTTQLHWAVVSEMEGYANPSVEQLTTELEYLRDRYASKPAYLKLRGRFVVVAYGSSRDTCDAVERWLAANANVHAWLIMKIFPGWESCPRQPDGWYQFSGNHYEFSLGDAYFGIGAGYEKTGVQVAPTVPRVTLDVWRTSAADMVASGARNQFVISFNEWGESSAIESAAEWASQSGYGAYLDVLHEVFPALPAG